VRLRGQLVLSHMVSIVAAAAIIGAINLLILVRETRRLERETLAAAVSAAEHVLGERIARLGQARDEMAIYAANMGPLASTRASLAELHAMLLSGQVERVEVFAGLRKEVEAYRWERGVGGGLETTWLPTNPRIAAQVADGRPATWIQAGPGQRASLKLCAAVPGGDERARRWVVVTEPLDGVLMGSLLPSRIVGAIENDNRMLAAWPETPTVPGAALESLSAYLPSGPFSSLFGPQSARRTALQLDDGSALTLSVLASPAASGRSLLVGMRTWLLVLAAGALVALALGSGVASRLLSPLQALLEGTGAMARGHLMVRLPTDRHDELGALMREFNRMADEIRATYLGVISTLAEVVEAKSHYTRAHIERVERLTLATLEVLERRGWVRFSSHQRFVLSVAAILHDVGKIAISNEILNKSGPLDLPEREQILAHPEVGASIVERIGKLERAAEIIRCAHEHFDGSGYPRGLQGEEIPLESRIILAVDALDAMIMDRPYSVGRPLERALVELHSEAGKQFDPVVVEALIEVISSVGVDSRNGDSGVFRVLAGDSDSLAIVTPVPRVSQG
jgi:HD-GYP domain-containing protein (c-di-GMP phosphodiesterase class II)